MSSMCLYFAISWGVIFRLGNPLSLLSLSISFRFPYPLNQRWATTSGSDQNWSELLASLLHIFRQCGRSMRSPDTVVLMPRTLAAAPTVFWGFWLRFVIGRGRSLFACTRARARAFRPVGVTRCVVLCVHQFACGGCTRTLSCVWCSCWCLCSFRFACSGCFFAGFFIG